MYCIFMSGSTPGFLVWRLSMKWRVAVDRAVAPLGLTHAQYALLGTLFGMQRGGRGSELRADQRPSQRQLADRTGLEPLYVSKLARALESAGLVDRHPDPTDTRAVQLVLTGKGHDVTAQAVVIVQRLQDQLLAPLGGLGSERTEALVADLNLLLESPLETSLEALPATPPDAKE
jgi:DNA-binding MarR family transcriptional regulator